MVAAGGCVAADHLADRFGLLPADITLMGVRHQRQPVAACFAADLHLDAGPVVARHDGRLTIGIDAAVDGVLSERQHRPASQLPHECRSAGRTMECHGYSTSRKWVL